MLAKQFSVVGTLLERGCMTTGRLLATLVKISQLARAPMHAMAVKTFFVLEFLVYNIVCSMSAVDTAHASVVNGSSGSRRMSWMS